MVSWFFNGLVTQSEFKSTHIPLGFFIVCYLVVNCDIFASSLWVCNSCNYLLLYLRRWHLNHFIIEVFVQNFTLAWDPKNVRFFEWYTTMHYYDSNLTVTGNMQILQNANYTVHHQVRIAFTCEPYQSSHEQHPNQIKYYCIEKQAFQFDILLDS